MDSIGVIGAGKWGQALFYSFKKAGFKTLITSRTKRDIEGFTTLKEVLNLKYIVIAISSQNIHDWLHNSFEYKEQKILVASKGIDSKRAMFMHEIYQSHVKKEHLAFISGPSFAKEVREYLPTAIVINSYDESLASEFCKFFPTNIKTYTSKDVIGAEIVGSYKNTIAIAAGICEGLKLGNNARVALISRGLVEMVRFAKSFNSNIEMDTFYGLSGAGDLFLTASSVMSRNFRVGMGLAQRRELTDILKELNETAEGVQTVYAIKKMAQKNGVRTPIIDELYDIIENGKDPQISKESLL